MITPYVVRLVVFKPCSCYAIDLFHCGAELQVNTGVHNTMDKSSAMAPFDLNGTVSLLKLCLLHSFLPKWQL